MARALVCFAMSVVLATTLLWHPWRAFGQCAAVNINCVDPCGAGLCYGCGGWDSGWVWPDFAISCSWTGSYCLYCWTGCTYPYHMCVQTRVVGIHRCPGEAQYQSFYAAWCCNYCL